MRLVLLVSLVAGCTPVAPPTSAMIGGTQSLFLGEKGFGQYNRGAEPTTGERLRRAIRTGNPLDGEMLNRQAVQLAMLQSAEPPAALAAQVGPMTGNKGRFLKAGARRFAYVAGLAADHPVVDACGYQGELIPTKGGAYDPRELCWWKATFEMVGVAL